jgi:hypothetical protein
MKAWWMGVACAMAMAAACAGRAMAGAGWSVPVEVQEPAGVARAAEPASGGIPFKPGQVKDVADLALVTRAGEPVPAQFTKLAGYDDGSVQWALVDLVVPQLPGNGQVSCRIQPGRTVPPLNALKIAETDDRIVVDTGVLAFAVSKANFALFDEVTVGGRKVVSGGSIDLLNCELGEQKGTPEGSREVTIIAKKANGRLFPLKTGRPTRVSWEYRGPVRATLRVDGEYLGETGAGLQAKLSYTTRITAWAGVGAVRVEHSIRNSNPADGYDAYIQRAALTLRLAFEAEAQAHEAPGEIPVATLPPPRPVEASQPLLATTASTRPRPAPRPGDYSAKPCDDWASGADIEGAFGLVVQNRHTGGIYRGPGTYLRKLMDCGWSTSWPGLFAQSVKGREAVVEIVSPGPALTGKGTERGALGFTQDGTFVLADRSHKDSEVWFDFYAGRRDVAVNAARAAACRSKLLVVAPGECYSETETLGSGHFGTLDDEVATYQLWGWKGWDDRSKYPRLPHQPFAFVPMEWMHDVSEDDAVEGYLLQFLRTKQRGFFDWGEAFNGFFRCHAVFRCDWGERWGVPAAAGRAERGLRFGWYGPHYYDWCDSRMHYCHQYGRGLFDYYCLTGNVDSLEAGLDLAQEMSAGYDRYKPGGEMTLGRTFGRAFNTALRAYQVTRDLQWKKVADRYAATILEASNWDAEKKVYLQSMGGWYSYFTREWAEQVPGNKVYVVPPRLLDYLAKNGISVSNVRGKGIAAKGDQKWEVTHLTQVFELSECHQAMERYARVMNSEPMKKRLVDLTRGIIKYYWSEKCQFMLDRGYIGWPEKDQAFDCWRWMESHDRCPNDPCGIHSGYSTRYIADMCARAYSFSGDRYFLDWSKTCWNRGSKRLYQQDRQIASDDAVGEFAYIRGAHADTVLECSARLTYEWPRAK